MVNCGGPATLSRYPDRVIPDRKIFINIHRRLAIYFFCLQTFFDGVQARVASGIKASEVSYQLAFSKQELRKVINQYPGSQVLIK